MNIDFILNGEDVSIQARAGDRLSEILRNEFSLLGVRSDCCAGRCGRCIVTFNGMIVNSCLIPAFRVRGAEVVTIEGFARTDEYNDVKKGFERAGFEPCDFCYGARALIASVIADETSAPTTSYVHNRMSAVECRCTQPSTILKAIRSIAEIREQRIYGRAGK
jgi:aerobic carbon-monoxide dehydrogenase small subunit